MPPNPDRAAWSADTASWRDDPLDGPFPADGVTGSNGSEVDEGWGWSNPPAPPHVDAWAADPRDVRDYAGLGADDGFGYDPGDDAGFADAAADYDSSRPRRAAPTRAADDDGDYGDYDEYDDDDLDYDDYFDDDEDDFVDVEATSSATRNALEWAVVLVGAVLVALLLRASLFQAFWIPSESMETTLLTNDRVLVNKVSYRLHDIHRGDVIVFARPDQEPGEIRDLIKRVIALPGETVEAQNNTIYINGQRLVEPYLEDGIITDDFGPTVVPEGEVFVMGDNRGDSYDSRWFGTVAEDRVIGRAFVLFWPVGRLGSL